MLWTPSKVGQGALSARDLRHIDGVTVVTQRPLARERAAPPTAAAAVAPFPLYDTEKRRPRG